MAQDGRGRSKYDQVVIFKLDRETRRRLELLAARHDRSMAAELRYGINQTWDATQKGKEVQPRTSVKRG